MREMPRNSCKCTTSRITAETTKKTLNPRISFSTIHYINSLIFRGCSQNQRCAQMNYVDEDGTLGSGDDTNMLDGHSKRQPVTPSSSGHRKRSRKTAGDVIVDAMLEIATA
ncbi:hypothetical protein Q3G72_004229 [Acer saccharum]|nr:hypothetical protein Q3G72_004229 [Acer saccharum]